MHTSWNIIYYESSRGDKPIEEFVDSLPEKAQAKIVRAFELLEEFGTRLRAPHIKKITTTDLWEFRVLGSDNIRILYIAWKEHSFLVLHIFKKKGQKTDRNELFLALKRLERYRLAI